MLPMPCRIAVGDNEMLDTYDAAVYHPNGHVYFFRGRGYLKYKPGVGLVPTSDGSVLRTIGENGWTSFPTRFRSNLDAGMQYVANGHLYFFKGNKYIKYKPGSGVVKTSTGSMIRTIGVTGWESLPPSFHSDLDAVLYYGSNGHVYFFKNNKYVKYKPGTGVVRTSGNQSIRTIGVTGWKSLPATFRSSLDTVLDYPKTKRTYFFKGREYVRYRPSKGVDPRYPRRIGLHHRKHGGWPGLSSFVAAPTTVDVGATHATIWLWIAGEVNTADFNLKLNGKTLQHPIFVLPDLGVSVVSVVGAIGVTARGSTVKVLKLTGLKAKTAYHLDFYRKGRPSPVESVSFRTAISSKTSGRIRFVLGSCANMTLNADVGCYEAIVAKMPDFAVFAGDNCYYYASDLSNMSRLKDGDWRSMTKMLTRQLEARNHPQFVPLVRNVPIFGTWDDHDCGFNNVGGAEPGGNWVGRNKAAGVFRALWSHGYRNRTDLYYEFVWGPIHFFVTDGRFFKRKDKKRLLGATQRDTLESGLRNSASPLKVVVFGNVALHTGHGEGLRKEADPEYQSLINVLKNEVGGRVLVLSGDVHCSECNFYGPTADAVKILEVTSSPLRVKEKKGWSEIHSHGDRRMWLTREQSFALIDVDIRASQAGHITNGTVTIQAIGESGQVLGDKDDKYASDCESTWDLATGVLT